jgi:hypothetical protein
MPSKFHENLQIGSKVISGVHTYMYRQTHIQTGNLINLLSFLESRLKTGNKTSYSLKLLVTQILHISKSNS